MVSIDTRAITDIDLHVLGPAVLKFPFSHPQLCGQPVEMTQILDSQSGDLE